MPFSCPSRRSFVSCRSAVRRYGHPPALGRCGARHGRALLFDRRSQPAVSRDLRRISDRSDASDQRLGTLVFLDRTFGSSTSLNEYGSLHAAGFRAVTSNDLVFLYVPLADFPAPVGAKPGNAIWIWPARFRLRASRSRHKRPKLVRWPHFLRPPFVELEKSAPLTTRCQFTKYVQVGWRLTGR